MLNNVETFRLSSACVLCVLGAARAQSRSVMMPAKSTMPPRAFKRPFGKCDAMYVPSAVSPSDPSEARRHRVW